MTGAELWLEKHIDSMVNDICTLVKIPSISNPGESEEMPFGKACAEAVACTLDLGSRMGFEPENCGNICGTLLWKGNKKEEIGIFGHADVVPAGNGWSYDPFNPVVKDGMIIGRGVADNKGSYMAALYALWYLKESGYRPEHSWRFFVGTNEEKGMEDISYYTKHYTEPVFSIVPDVTFPVCNGEKGVLELDAEQCVRSRVLLAFSSGIMSNAVPADACADLYIEDDMVARLKVVKLEQQGCSAERIKAGVVRVHMSGIAAHAAFPEGSESAEVKLAQCLLNAEILDEPAQTLMEGIISLFGDYYGAGIHAPLSDDISGRLTHVGGIASYKDGVFRQNINIRYNIKADYESMMEGIEKALADAGFTLVGVRNSSPCYLDADSEEVKRLTEICCRHLGGELHPYVMGGGTYARKLKRAVGFGPGIPDQEKRFGTEKGGAHQPDEYMEIEDLKRAFLIYADAIPELDRMIHNQKQV